MSVEDHDDDLATQYVLARRQRPDLDEQGLAEFILAKLSQDQLLTYAGDALAWAQHPADREELALSYVRNFVLAMETDPDTAPG
ncbi:MAG TPA: hypothetical protein VGJ13_15655 [Pseudonocardiaceae bacterium]|jgi:hypothetical protein